jgi:hypothetical protein
MMSPIEALGAGPACVTIDDYFASERRPTAADVAAADELPQVLTTRVDHLCVGLAVDFRPDVAALVRVRGERANMHGGASLQVGDFLCELKASRDKDKWFWVAKGLGLRGTIDLAARPPRDGTAALAAGLAAGHPGFTMEIIVDGARLLETPTLATVFAKIDDVARRFGRCIEQRLRRIDLAADVANFTLTDHMGHLFLLPRGVKKKGVLGTYFPELYDDDDDTSDDRAMTVRFRNVEKVTGYTVCPGNAVMLRMYDKTEELSLPGRESKQAMEHGRWKVAGWNEKDQVTRVEFQIRSAALEEAAMRDPRKLESMLDAAWQYLTRCWVRLTVPLSASRRCREETDPRWRAIQAIQFRSEAEPLKRVRNRGGATMRQGWGSMISSLAAVGKLPKPRQETFPCSECDDGPEGCSVCRDKAETRVRGSVLAMAVTFGMEFADELLSNQRRIQAAEELATRLGAVHGRFAESVKDNPTHYWYVRTNERGELVIDVAETSSHGPAPFAIDAPS